MISTNPKTNPKVPVLLMLLLFYSSEDTKLLAANPKLMIFNIILLLIILCVLSVSSRLSRLSLLFFLILSVFVLMSMIVNMDYHGYSMFLILLIALMFSELYTFEVFYEGFEKLVYYLTIVTLVHMTIRVILCSSCFQLLDKIVFIEKNHAIPWGFRLYGFCREPAMYCIYLTLAIARCLFIKNNTSHIIIYFIALFFTGSLTGYISIFFLLISCYFLFPKSRLSFSLIMILSIPIMLFIFKTNIFSYLINRMKTTGDSSASSNSRYYSIIIGIILGLRHAFFGAGASRSMVLFNEMSITLLGDAFCWANMVTYLFASFGFFFVFTFLFGLSNLFSDKKKSTIMVITICLLLCGETMTYSSIMYILMFYGLGKQKNVVIRA